MSIKIEMNNTVITVDSVAEATELLNSLNANANNNFMNNVPFNAQPFTNDLGSMPLSPISALDYSINNYMNFVKATNNYRYHLIITKINDVEALLIYDMKKNKYYTKENPGKWKEISKSVYDDLAPKYRNNQHLIEYDAPDDYRIDIDSDIKKQNESEKDNDNDISTDNDDNKNRYHITVVRPALDIKDTIKYIYDNEKHKYYANGDHITYEIDMSNYMRALSRFIIISDYYTDNIDDIEPVSQVLK